MATLNLENDAFSSAQIQSKLWLIQSLERCLDNKTLGYCIYILAGWYGITNLLLRTRNNIRIKEVRSFDIDPSCQEAADAINNLWVWKNWEFKAITQDINSVDYSAGPDVVINSSVEHMSSNIWFDNIPKGTIVCLQASDMDHDDHVNKFKNSFDMMDAYKLREYLFEGTKMFEYEDKLFSRSMIIGIK